MGITRANPLRAHRPLIDIALSGMSAWAGRAMDEQETGYDYVRYKQLLAEAVDETKRLELIEIMIRENARDRLEAQRTADRIAMTVMTVAAFSAPAAVATTSRTVRHFSEASITSEPSRPISAPARRPYCRIAAPGLGLRPPLPARRAARLT